MGGGVRKAPLLWMGRSLIHGTRPRRKPTTKDIGRGEEGNIITGSVQGWIRASRK